MHNVKQQRTVFIRFPSFLGVLFRFYSYCLVPFEMFPVDHLHLWHLLFHSSKVRFGNKMHVAHNQLVCGLCSIAMEGNSNKQTALS